MALWRSKPKYVTVHPQPVPVKRDIPDGLWTKCERCGEIIYNKELERNLRVCPKCNYHFRLGARQRLALLADADSFQEYDRELVAADPLGFMDYPTKVAQNQRKTNLGDAIITGEADIEGTRTVLGVMDYNFMLGSMGSVVGEKVTRAVERAIEKRLPVVMVCACGGGARMQEGIFSLMQMAKTSAAFQRLAEARLLYISVLTDATMAGVLASFASLGDILIAEPGAMIGFAGPRVIEQTIREKLPPGSHRAEFLYEHGFLDLIVHRQDLRATLGRLLRFHSATPGGTSRQG